MIFYQENFFNFDVFEISFSNIFISRLDTFVG